MATLPVEGRWSIKSLSDDDIAAALAFLRRDPLINVYLISRILEERIRAVDADGRGAAQPRDRARRVAGDEHRSGRRSGRCRSDVTETAIAVDRRPHPHAHACRCARSSRRRTSSKMLWARLRTRLDPPTVVRMNQPVYAIRGRLDFPDLTEARYATLRDLDALVPACAAMHKEEVGIDPLDRDAAGYRERVRELIEQKRSVIRVRRRRRSPRSASSRRSRTTPCSSWASGPIRASAAAAMPRALLREVCGHLRAEREDGHVLRQRLQPASDRALRSRSASSASAMNRALIW